MKKSELKEIIKAAMSEDMGKSVFDTNKPGRIGEFIKSLDSLVDEYHAELYLNDELFTALDAVKEAAQMEMGREDEMGDIPGFEGTRDALGGLGLEEAKKDEEEEEVEDVEVDAEEEITLDEPEEEEMDTDVEAPSAKELSGDEKELQSNLEKALGAAKAMGDEKLSNQIGNTITFFTRTHVVGDTGNVEEVELNEENIGLADIGEMGYAAGEAAFEEIKGRFINKPDHKAYREGFFQGFTDNASSYGLNEEEEVELNEEYTRMQKLAGITINEELYDFVKDIKNAVGLNQSLNNIEYYLGRDINDEERGALINAGVLRQVSGERYGSQYKKIQRRRY